MSIRYVDALEAENTSLRKQLTTARADALEEAARWHDSEETTWLEEASLRYKKYDSQGGEEAEVIAGSHSDAAKHFRRLAAQPRTQRE